MENKDADNSISCSTPLNRADAVRRQSIEVVQLAKSDVEELHAKLKTLQEVLTEGDREKMQLEAQITALKAQSSNSTENSVEDPVVLLDTLIAVIQRPLETAESLQIDSGFVNKLSLLLTLCQSNTNTAIKRSGEFVESGQNGISNATHADQNSANNNSVDASSSVQQCSAITTRFQEKIDRQQETIERLNNALEEVESTLEESHAKNANLSEQIERLQEDIRQLRNGKVSTPDEVKEPSSSTDVATSSTSESNSDGETLRAELANLNRELDSSRIRESELVARCADFSHQIENLTSQLAESQGSSGQGADSQAKLESLKRENQNLMLELSEVQHSLNRMQGENERLKANGGKDSVVDTESEGLRKTIEETTQRLTETQGALEKARAEVAEAVKEAEAQREKAEGLGTRVNDLQSDVDIRVGIENKLKAEIEALKGSVEKSEALLSESNEANDSLKRTMEELETKVKELEEENLTLKEQESMAPPSLETEMLLEELRNDLAASRAAFDNKEREIEKLNGKIVDLESSLSKSREESSAKIAELDLNIEQLKRSLSASESEIEDLKESVESESDKKKSLESQVEKLTKDLSESESNTDALRAEVEELKEKLEEGNLESKQAILEMEKAKKDFESLKNEKQSASQAQSELKDELETALKKLEKLEAQATGAEDAKEEVRAKLRHATDENGRIMQELKAMEEEKTSLHVDLVKCRQQLSDTTQMRTALEKLKAENADLKHVAERARKDVERLRSENEEALKANERALADACKARQEAASGQAAATRDREALMSEIASLSEKHLKVNTELESVRGDNKKKLELIGQVNTQLSALRAQHVAIVQKAKDTSHEKDTMELQMSAMKTEISAKVSQVEKISKDMRAQMAHNDNLKKQVSKLVMAVAEKEKLIVELHSENKNLRQENQIYNEKQKGQDALINRIASLEQDIVNSKMTISKVCAEREDSLRQLEEFRKKHSSVVTDADAKVAKSFNDQKVYQERLAKTQEMLDDLKKRFDIALSERTIAESRCRATLNLSRKLEREANLYQKEKERMTKEIEEQKDHVKHLEGERSQLLKSMEKLPSMTETLQLENQTLRAENARLKDRNTLTGLSKKVKSVDDLPSIDNAQPKASVAPLLQKKKTIFERPKTEKDGSEEKPPVSSDKKQKVLEIKSEDEQQIQVPQPAPRRRGVRRSASEVEAPAKRPSIDAKPENPKARSKVSSSTEEEEDVDTSSEPRDEPAPKRRNSKKEISKPTPPKPKGFQTPNSVKSRDTGKARTSEGQPKGRRSLIKGTPKKSMTTVSSPAAESPTGGRSLRASTLVVKKASDSDAKQREQFKKRSSSSYV